MIATTIDFIASIFYQIKKVTLSQSHTYSIFEYIFKKTKEKNVAGPNGEGL